MSFQWLQMRITEEKDRRAREQRTLERLPDALLDLYEAVRSCVESYTSAFGHHAAEAELLSGKVRIVAREERDGQWEEYGTVEINTDPSLPGFQIERSAGTMVIELGLLPGNKASYRDRATDQYLTPDELSRRILDRLLFPKLKE